MKKRYVEFKVYSVIKVKKKYGYRIKLKDVEGNEFVQQKSGFESKKIAEKEREKTIAELYNGTYVIDEKIKVADFLLEWLEKYKKPKVTYNTYMSYRNAITKYIIPALGNLILSLLNRGHIQKFYNDVIKICSNSELKIIKPILNTSLDYAVNKKLLIKNPAREIELPKSVVAEKYRERKINIQKTLTLEQVLVLIEESKKTPIHLQVIFAVLMGLRRGEINGLKYSDIDFVRRKILIQRQLGNKANTDNSELKIGEYTKQEIPVKTLSSNRELDLPDYVFEAILEEKAKYERNRNRRINDKTTPFKDYGFICCSTYGNPRSKYYHFQHWKRLLKKCNLPDIRFHDLRATYSTLLLKNDFNVKAVSKLMGHSKEIITADVYGDTQEIICDCVDDIERYISRVEPVEEEDLVEDIELDSIVNNFLEISA